MSKIGKKSIALGTVKAEVVGNEVRYSGAKDKGVYLLTPGFAAVVEGGYLKILADTSSRGGRSRKQEINRMWGLHRALLANKLRGAEKEFERKMEINGLGFKASIAGRNVVFSLGYSHKVELPLPDGISLEIDKTGQKLLYRATDKERLGQHCSMVRAQRPPLPYDGTGIKFDDEVIIRKAGKTKSA